MKTEEKASTNCKTKKKQSPFKVKIEGGQRDCGINQGRERGDNLRNLFDHLASFIHPRSRAGHVQIPMRTPGDDHV